jgi:hypothetical protein
VKLALLALTLGACNLPLIRNAAAPTYTVVCTERYCNNAAYQNRCSYDFHDCELRKESATHFGMYCRTLDEKELAWFDKRFCHVFPENEVADPKTTIGGGK